MKFILKSSACIEYFDHVVFMSDAWAGHQQYNLCKFGDQQYKLMKVLRDPFLKSGTVPEIRGLLRPMLHELKLAYKVPYLIQCQLAIAMGYGSFGTKCNIIKCMTGQIPEQYEFNVVTRI